MGGGGGGGQACQALWHVSVSLGRDDILVRAVLCENLTLINVWARGLHNMMKAVLCGQRGGVGWGGQWGL